MGFLSSVVDVVKRIAKPVVKVAELPVEIPAALTEKVLAKTGVAKKVGISNKELHLFSLGTNPTSISQDYLSKGGALAVGGNAQKFNQLASGVHAKNNPASTLAIVSAAAAGSYLAATKAAVVGQEQAIAQSGQVPTTQAGQAYLSGSGGGGGSGSGGSSWSSGEMVAAGAGLVALLLFGAVLIRGSA